LLGQALLGKPAFKTDIFQAPSGGQGLDLRPRLPRTNKFNEHRRILAIKDLRCKDDGLCSVERKKRTEKKDIKLFSLIPIFSFQPSKKVTVITDRQYLHSLAGDVVFLTIIVLVGEGIG
jgi:hypothetical protein